MEAQLFITGVISPSYEDYPSTSLEYVKSALEWQKPFDTVRVTINSPGGWVTEGMGIYDYLRSLPDCTIITEALGQCSSIATAIFLAGSERRIHTHTDFLIHLPSGGAEGTAAQMQQYVDDLKRDQQDIINLYVERAGVEEAAVAELMALETALTAEQVLNLGFATLIVQPVTALARPSTASAPSSSTDETPSWANTLMSKFNAGMASLKTAMDALKKPATAQAPTAADDADAPTALDVTTDGGDTLTIDTGDRDAYAVGDAVTDADGNAPADADYVLTDGNTISVASGAITAITPAATDEAPTASADTDGAMTLVLSAITNLANEVKDIKQAQAQQGVTVNRVAAATGSNARPPRAAAPTSGKEADEDPVKAAAAARAERRANRYKQG